MHGKATGQTTKKQIMKTTKKKSQLEIKVLGVNLWQKYAKQILAHELKYLDKLQGLDIFKTDGSLKQKYQYPKLEGMEGNLPDGTFYRVTYFSQISGNEYGFEITCQINGGSYEEKTYFCLYEKNRLYPYDVKEGKLIRNTRTYKWLDKMHDVAVLQAKADKVKKLGERYTRERDKIDYQFTDVLGVDRLTRS